MTSHRASEEKIPEAVTDALLNPCGTFGTVLGTPDLPNPGLSKAVMPIQGLQTTALISVARLPISARVQAYYGNIVGLGNQARHLNSKLFCTIHLEGCLQPRGLLMLLALSGQLVFVEWEQFDGLESALSLGSIIDRDAEHSEFSRIL